MRSGALRQHQHTDDDEDRENRRRDRAAQARPPSLTGLSRKSPTVAPSGRDSMKASQNSATREIEVPPAEPAGLSCKASTVSTGRSTKLEPGRLDCSERYVPATVSAGDRVGGFVQCRVSRIGAVSCGAGKSDIAGAYLSYGDHCSMQLRR